MNDSGFLEPGEAGVSTSLAAGETAVHVRWGQGRKEWKAEIHSGWIPPVQRPRARCPSPRPPVPLAEQPWISPSRVSPAHWGQLPSLHIRSPVLPAGPSAPVWRGICTAVGSCSQVSGVEGIKVHLPGPGRLGPPRGPLPGPSRPILEHSLVYSLCVGFSFYIPFGDFHSSLAGWDFDVCVQPTLWI